MELKGLQEQATDAYSHVIMTEIKRGVTDVWDEILFIVTLVGEMTVMNSYEVWFLCRNSELCDAGAITDGTVVQ